MAKPIFIVELPHIISNSERNLFTKELEVKMSDYHVIVFIGVDEQPKFQCFYEKDFNVIKYKELQKLINNRIK